MYKLNINKMQQLPRGKDGRVSAGSKRNRLSQANFESDEIKGRVRVLHPTKGWRDRSLDVIERHADFMKKLA